MTLPTYESTPIGDQALIPGVPPHAPTTGVRTMAQDSVAALTQNIERDRKITQAKNKILKVLTALPDDAARRSVVESLSMNGGGGAD